MHALSQETLPTPERIFIDQVIARMSDRPGSLLGILETVQEHNPDKYLPPESFNTLPPKQKLRSRASIAWPLSMRSLIYSLRVRTRFASAVARLATRVVRAICYRVSVWDSG